MANYRRSRIKGGTYFFTVVTFHRRKVFSIPEARVFLREAIREVRELHPFTVDAWVLLPEHMHCMWTLPPDDHDFSKRWGRIKAGFSKRAGSMLQKEALSTSSRRKHRESTIWQRRFWEHAIRDDVDLRNHIDYIHFNPVKHGLVKNVCDWPYSTFHRYVDQGMYTGDWGNMASLPEIKAGE